MERPARGSRTAVRVRADAYRGATGTSRPGVVRGGTWARQR
ncbi:hypothetical protein STTU_3181 [Streptomyces sp. Tu6071]|nr:hypothetical protein STTU_3181 [Streptomyces sp. Tu6071]